jgi:hypothetical protein
MDLMRWIFLILEGFINVKSKKNSELRDKLEMIDAGSLDTIFNKAESMGIDLFDDPRESNGYVKNNNAEIEKVICAISPYFNARAFVRTSQQIFKEVASARTVEELSGEVALYVDRYFDFSAVEIDRIENFSASYLHLYKRQNGNEILQVYISFNDSNIHRFFMRFKRKSQFEVVDCRRVKTTACPNCGAPVFFKRGNTEKCRYCGQYVMFEEYGWQMYEIEKITADTYIDNVGVR